jgi:hypothetical protein
MAGRRLNDWLKAYMEYTSALEAPDTFHFWTGVSTIAGALRRQVWIDQVHFQWTPNFYIILVAPPGLVNKTTTIGVGTRLLRNLPDINFGPNAITWQALVQALAESTTAIELPDGTYQQMSCITCSSGELGSLLDPHDRSMIDVLTDLWDGRLDTWKKVTKSSGTDIIENPWINIVAATTPAWLADNLGESAVGGGFTSRCIFVYGEKKRHYIALPRYHMQEAHPEIQKDLIHDLERIGMLRGEFTFTSDAVKWAEQWYREHWEKNAATVATDRMVGYIGRKQTHKMKVAMVLSASARDDLIITVDDLQAAATIVDSLEGYQSQIFDRIGQTDGGRYTAMIMEHVVRAGVIEKSDLLRKVMRVMDEKTFQNAVNTAIAAKLAVQFNRGNSILIVDAARAKQPNT